MKNNYPNIHSLLVSFLNKDGGDSGWSVLAPAVHSPDHLTPFEKALLPLAYERWYHYGRNVENMHLLRGIYRKTLVKNRIFLIECSKVLKDLRAAKIEALVFKGGGLLGSLLPQKGLRAISDIDIWVRPSQIDLALQILGIKDKKLLRSEHAITFNTPIGLQLDLHMYPSHIFIQRYTTKQMGEVIFEMVRKRSGSGVMSTSDLVYYSFLNPLFAHSPGEDRAAFALLELNEALTASSVTDDVLKEVSLRIQDDQTASVFLDHFEWLGRKLFPNLDRFLNMAVMPSTTRRDLQLAKTQFSRLSKLKVQFEDNSWLVNVARMYELVFKKPFTRGAIYTAIFMNLYATLRHKPSIVFLWLSRRRSWQRLWKILFG
jgi:hypothetical protein